MEKKEIQYDPSTIETIDAAFYDWLTKDLDLFSTTNEGWKRTPVVWLSAERAYQLKSDKDIRDSSGLIKLPLITVQRSSIVKDPNRTGTMPANLRPVNDEKGGTITVTTTINQTKTSNFKTADARKSQVGDRNNATTVRDNRVYPLYDNRTREQRSNKIVYQTVTIPIPIYVVVSYQVNVRTDYQQQLNELTQPFFTNNGNTRYFQLQHEGHKYDAFIKGDFAFNNNANNLAEERKTYGATITVEVNGYLIGQDKNQQNPKVVIRENAVEVKIPRERVIYGDIPDFLSTSKNKTYYND
jgi:hypothetical protein